MIAKFFENTKQERVLNCIFLPFISITEDSFILVTGLGILRDDNDSYYIFGSDNNSLLLKAGLWVLHKWQRSLTGDRNVFDTPLGSLHFLSNFDSIIKAKFSFSTIDEIMKPDSECANIDFIILL